MKRNKKIKKVDTNAIYSLRQATDYTLITSREFLTKYIDKYETADWSLGRIWIRRNGGKGRTATRYVISGKWISEFNKRYKAGRLNILKPEAKQPAKFTLDEIRIYCESRGISLISDFLTSVQNEEKKQSDRFNEE
jgi:hypothetical protein